MILPPIASLKDDGWLAPHRPVLVARRDRARALRLALAKTGTLADFATGHQHFGLHREADGSWVYRDWAPNARALYLIGECNGWQEQPAFCATRVNEHGEWELHMAPDALHHGQLYRIRMHWENGSGERMPAWGQRVVQDEQTKAFNAQVWAPAEPFAWRHTAPPPGPTLIYEAHAGMAQEDAKVSTWDEFRRLTLPRIKEAGYNTVQLMAVQEHPYYGSFGYHVGSFFATSSRFGTPEELKALIDEAHGMGLRVIMDLVHSHAVKNEVEGISRYDGSPYQFFHDGPRGNHSAWDSRCFDYAKPEVLHFLLSNVRYWLEEFRFDGFRFDGVTSMLYLDHGLGSLFTSYDDYFGPRVDEDALTYLTLATQLTHEINPHAIAIAEDVSGMPGLGAATEEGGVGFDYRLAMGVPDIWFKLTDLRDEDWSMNGLWHELTNRRGDERTISYVESHDQALVGGKSFIFTLIDADMYWAMHLGSQSLRVDRGVALHKLARLTTLGLAAHGYLNFMGNEFGHPEWIDFPREGNGWSCDKARRQWSLRDNPALRFKGLADFDQAMLGLVSARWDRTSPSLVKADDGDKLLAWLRGELLFVCNYHTTNSFEGYGLRVPEGEYELVLSTDDSAFGGFHRVQSPQRFATDADGWIRLYLPNRTGLVLRTVSSTAA
ncbi:MAG: alpha amylase C-terminal domain-containing protein [Verrucomicrobiaceae bacterium]|nr:alpha amylase C-terminal domain-containing protein [Verrucomicrobiaceae bacterium]